MSKEVKFRHKFLNPIFRLFVGPHFRRKFKYKRKINKIKKDGPYLILCNHTTAYDPLIVGTCFNFPLYYVATDQLFNLGLLSKLLIYAVNPIPKQKSVNDLNTIKKMKRIIKEGGSVCIFVEGNLNYDGVNSLIPKGYGKLIKFLDASVIFVKTHGMYLSDPRWSVNRKYGKTFVEVSKPLVKSEYSQLSEEELQELVIKNTYVNTYDDEIISGIKYDGKDRALGLERLLFVCSQCGSLSSLYSQNDLLKCRKCSYEAVYNEYGYLEYLDKKYSLKELFEHQLVKLHTYFKTFNIVFENKAQLEDITNNKKNDLGMISLRFDAKGVSLKNETLNKEFSYNEVNSLTIQGKRKLIMYISDEKYLISFMNLESPYKYYLFYLFNKHYLKTNKFIDLKDFRM